MNIYFAPLEGITTSIYRNTHAECFGACDAYYAPFITPSDNERISRKGLYDVLPERNTKQNLKVQVLTNQAQSFLQFAQKAKLIGYEELNLNIGCPFERVVRKGRGAGFLQVPEALDTFFKEIFDACDMKITVKTRTGYSDSSEMEGLLTIFNRYSIAQLTVHPRTRNDFYKGKPDMAVFKRVYEHSVNPLCYNGDVLTVADYDHIINEYPALEGVMLGRGAVRNPALFREIKGGAKLQTKELYDFSKKLAENYYEELQSETFTLHKVKEVWTYMLQLFPEDKKLSKAIKKADKLTELISAISYLPVL